MATSYPKILHDNRFKDATPVASTTASGFNVLNLRDWRRFTWWKPTATPSTVTVNCGSAKSADYGLAYAEAGTYEIRGSTDNFSASDILLGTITLSVTGFGWVSFNSASYQYWRLKSTSGTPAVAIAAIGAVLDIPAWLADGFDPLSRTAKGQSNRSVEGEPLGSVMQYEQWDETLKFEWVSETTGWAWVRNTWMPAWRAHLSSMPFVFVWEPVSYGTELLYVMAKGTFTTSHKPGKYVDLTLPLAGVVT